VRLAIDDGGLCTGSLVAPGFASAAQPDWASLAALRIPTPRLIKEHS